MGDYYRAISLYKQNYLNYKLTGNATYKTAYENAEAWIEKYLKSLEEQVAKDTSQIGGFINSYANASPELSNMQQQMKSIQREAPKLQDQYETEKRAMGDVPVDTTRYYMKGAAIAGTVGLIVALSLF